MKNFSSILNIILLIAVAILFYLHFSTPKNTVKEVTKVAEIETDVIKVDSLTQFMNLDSNIAAKPIKIAYVNQDSLASNLDMMKDVQARIEKKGNELNYRIKSKQKSLDREYENKVKSFNTAKDAYILSAPGLTEAQSNEKRKALGELEQGIMVFQQKAQQDLMSLDESIKQQFAEMRGNEMNKYYTKIQEFSQSFAKTLGFDYIMFFQEGGAFLYTNPDYDVSSYVIDAINKEYAQGKTKTTSTKK